MTKEWSTFMDGNNCNECDNYERAEKRLKKRIKELESAMQEYINYVETGKRNDPTSYEKFKQILKK